MVGCVVMCWLLQDQLQVCIGLFVWWFLEFVFCELMLLVDYVVDEQVCVGVGIVVGGQYEWCCVVLWCISFGMCDVQVLFDGCFDLVEQLVYVFGELFVFVDQCFVGQYVCYVGVFCGEIEYC